MLVGRPPTTLECIPLYNWGMDQQSIELALAELPLESIHYFDSIDSTNDEAARQIIRGCASPALVVADEQTAGRGRANRRWFTPRGAGLAFSLIFVPGLEDDLPTNETLSRYVSLGALAVCKSLAEGYGLQAEIKWPNDVLVDRKKISGVLAEAHWIGDRLQGVILGIGVNVKDAAIRPTEVVDYPACSIEDRVRSAGELPASKMKPVNRVELLRSIVSDVFHYLEQLRQRTFMDAWEERLAFRGEWVEVVNPFENRLLYEGVLVGLTADGSLKLRKADGELVRISAGDVSLRYAGQV